MKQQFLLASLAVLAMASCSKDDVVETNKGNAISFRSSMQTRAVETTTANLKEIYVTALDHTGASYFTDQLFSGTQGTSFTSDPKQFWPSEGDLKFFAYAPSAGDLGGTLRIENASKNLTDFSPKEDIKDQVDFITAKAKGNKSNTNGVELQFKHHLSQIEIQAKNSNTSYVFKVKGVRIGNPVSKATFNFHDERWDLATEKKSYTAEYDLEKTLGDAQSIMGDGNGSAMLIPQQLTAWNKQKSAKDNDGAYLAVKVNIKTKDGALVYPASGGYAWVAVPIATKWEAGKKYVYTLDFTNGAGNTDPDDPDHGGEEVFGGEITFNVIVTDWDTQNENLKM